MNVINCASCDNPLPESTTHCAQCGTSQSSEEAILSASQGKENTVGDEALPALSSPEQVEPRVDDIVSSTVISPATTPDATIEDLSSDQPEAILDHLADEVSETTSSPVQPQAAGGAETMSELPDDTPSDIPETPLISTSTIDDTSGHSAHGLQDIEDGAITQSFSPVKHDPLEPLSPIALDAEEEDTDVTVTLPPIAREAPALPLQASQDAKEDVDITLSFSHQIPEIDEISSSAAPDAPDTRADNSTASSAPLPDDVQEYSAPASVTPEEGETVTLPADTPTEEGSATSVGTQIELAPETPALIEDEDTDNTQPLLPLNADNPALPVPEQKQPLTGTLTFSTATDAPDEPEEAEVSAPHDDAPDSLATDTPGETEPEVPVQDNDTPASETLPFTPVAAIDSEQGDTSAITQNITDDPDATIVVKQRGLAGATRIASLMMPYFFSPGSSQSRRSATVNRRRRRAQNSLSLSLTGDTAGGVMLDEEFEEIEVGRQLTWQKVVEPSTSHSSASYPPRPSISAEDENILLRQPSLAALGFGNQMNRASWFWTSLVVLIVLGGAFGIAGTLGRSILRQPSSNGPSLQITPHTVAIGATMTLRGSGFSGGARVGLSRDTSIPVTDTGGNSSINADHQGNFVDTIAVTSGWGAGAHTIMAEDAHTHKVSSFSIQVTGKGVAQFPARLGISSSSWFAGSGDEAVNSFETLTLTNLGSGEISWQGSTTPSWLMITPTSGVIYSNAHSQVTVAVDRAHLAANSYTSFIQFSSNAGDVQLPVSMQVTPLVSGNQPVLQLSPALLSFTATDGSAAPAPQSITVANPGAVPLDWHLASNAPWLSATPQSGTIANAASQTVSVSINTDSLLPGTYMGQLTFSGQGMHSPQNIYVSVTVVPHCYLTVSQSVLNFYAPYQGYPAGQAVKLAGSADCTGAVNWHAASNDSWVTVNNATGTTPDSVSIGINSYGLTTGTYSSSVTFSSSAGTQTVNVNFTMNAPIIPEISSGTNALTFSSVAGQSTPATQTFTVTDNGSGSLNWSSSAATTQGGNWLTVSPASGALAPGQTATLSVTASPAATLGAGTYTGAVTVTSTGSVGSPQTVNVTLNVQAACTLQAPSTGTVNFVAAAGTNPTAKTFTLTTTGTCGAVVVTPTATMAAVNGWLAVTPGTAPLVSGTPATFTITITSATLAPGQYTGTIALAATSNGTTISGSPQAVTVTLTVGVVPTVTVTPGALTFNAINGVSTQALTIINSGGDTVNWTAALQAGAPNGVTLSAVNGANLASKTGAAINITVDPTTLTAGNTYTTGVVINATDTLTGLTAQPVTVQITITIAAAQPTQVPPGMQVAPQSLTFGAQAAEKPTPQALIIANAGGGTLYWTIAAPSVSWLTVSTQAGSDVAAAQTQVICTVDTSALAPNTTPYTTTLVITPSVGSPVTVTVSLTVTAPVSVTPTATV